jgi:hypothetical protein
MSFSIDTLTYVKPSRLPVGKGYNKRPTGVKPTKVVIHTTNPSVHQTFAQSCAYLRDSLSVSCHYVVGEAGEIAEILSPDWRAWHAGEAIAGWTNTETIGIECVHLPGTAWPAVQHDALTWLVRKLMHDSGIDANHIDTHRRIAVPGPNIRKHDPSDWSDAAFYAWRATLAPPPNSPPLLTGLYHVRRVAVYEGPSTMFPIALGGAAFLTPGEVVEIDEVKPEWAGFGHLKSGLGFVALSALERP